MTEVFLNDPPMLPPQPPPQKGQPTDINAVIASATAPKVPIMDASRPGTYDLPAGYVAPGGEIVTSVQVRELNGFDEEALGRYDVQANSANYLTQLILAGTELIGGTKPTREIVRELLIGDRDALMLFIRRVTYGDQLEFDLDCDVCQGKSKIGIHLVEDIEVTPLEDPKTREFEMELRGGGIVKIKLLDGYAQEAFSEGIGKKATTQAEINTLMLAKSITEVNRVQTFGNEDSVRALPSGDRAKILDRIAEIQPGPQLQKPVIVNCATCGKEYPIALGLTNLFRF